MSLDPPRSCDYDEGERGDRDNLHISMEIADDSTRTPMKKKTAIHPLTVRASVDVERRSAFYPSSVGVTLSENLSSVAKVNERVASSLSLLVVVVRVSVEEEETWVSLLEPRRQSSAEQLVVEVAVFPSVVW